MRRASHCPSETKKKSGKKSRKNVPAHSAHLESGQGGSFCSWPVASRVRGRARAGRRGYFAGSDGTEMFPWPCPENPIDASFSCAPRREELASITIARCLVRERTSVFIAAAGERAEKAASSCATSDGEQENFSIVSRTHGLAPLATRASLLSPPPLLDSLPES